MGAVDVSMFEVDFDELEGNNNNKKKKSEKNSEEDNYK